MPELSRRSFVALGGSFVPLLRPDSFLSLDGARFRVVRRGRANRHYIVIHGNEETARQVLERFLKSHPGTAFFITGERRNVPIGSGWLDPNRMFSRIGAERNLRLLNPDWSAAQIREALDALDRGRETLVRALLPPEGGLLFALHNNSEGYSMRDEIAASERTSLRSPAHPHEFFLCTDPGDYERLARSPYNVLLQSRVPQDDGSLSRLAARRGVRYVNLEVAFGKFDTQLEMLLWADRRLP